MPPFFIIKVVSAKGGALMKISELESRVDLLSLIEKDYKVKKVGVNTYRVIPCPVCGSKKCFNIKANENYYNTFSGCCQGGGVYKYLQEVKGMNEAEAYETLKELAGIEEQPVAYNNKKSAITQPPAKAEEKAPFKDYTNTIIALYNKQTEHDKQYFINRGLTDEVIKKYMLCIGDVNKLDNNYHGKRAIIPIWEGGKVVSYNARALEENPEIKYMKPKGESVFFNIEYLDTAQPGELIAICEGEFDALSLESIGIKAIAIGGSENISRLLKKIEQAPKAKGLVFMTAFDNDKAGEKAAKKAGYPKIEIPSKYKDINEWHKAEPEAIKTAINEQIKAAARPDAVSEYLSKAFITDIEKFKTYQDKKTGFYNLDEEMGGLYAGLYVVGGISSVGKTTFIHQLGDQLAEQGEHIIYFSLEQSKLELVSKSLARITAKQDYNSAVTGISIRSGYIPKQVLRAAEAYEKTAQRVNIIEGNFDTTTETIRAYIDRYISLNNVKPIVIIDYLQIIPGDPRIGDKQRTDSNVTELKRISRDFDLTMFVISSLNRSNYLTPIDFESFKESGGIEYTADVIWGLQLQAINDDIFNSDKKIREKRERIKQAKAEDPRKIELVCLKNRNGKPHFSCNFAYYPKYDLFSPEPF